MDVVVLSDEAQDSTKKFISGNYKFISEMRGVRSSQVLFLHSKREPEPDETVQTIAEAGIVFFDGGRQCDYVEKLKDPKLLRAIEAVYERGGGIGGTSAGEALQGHFVFDGCSIKNAVTSALALADPYDDNISFTYDLFRWRFAENTVLDQLFVTRDRMGRILAFLARQIQDRKAPKAFGIGVDANSSVVVRKNGLATVVGKKNAYFVEADHKPQVCEKGKPLTYSNFKVWKRKPGETFDLRHHPHAGYYLVSVKDGKLDRDPY